MQCAKIHLSTEQIKLVTNADWILTKNEILNQIKNTFEHLYQQQQQILNVSALPEEILKFRGKISRGENYMGLPWLVLDYPRCFVKGNIFAIRTLFWWGKLFSTTLHLSGRWQQYATPKLLEVYPKLLENHFLLSNSGNEWIHDSTSAVYKPLNKIAQSKFEKALNEATFIKIAAHINIESIETATETLMKQFKFLLSILK